MDGGIYKLRKGLVVVISVPFLIGGDWEAQDHTGQAAIENVNNIDERR